MGFNMILGRLKTYAIIAGGALLSALLIAVKVLTAQNSRLRRKAETAEARVHHAKVVLQKDKEVDEQTDVHLAEVAKEVEEGKSPSELTDPNKHWTDFVRDDSGDK